ncbi:hypothetical protein [Winogradskyella sp. PG-2]|uniref:hypothetical protein n=1 Tax=Winogradskyella sp. PG-2 TaxID=754409 RepID=UPI0004586BC0|nr:hypothetical protein [Winogradskyella sp. PG-2]BAO75861.1 hypothetical protein WPG_1631 [Winogradskyella sp. PG-2]
MSKSVDKYNKTLDTVESDVKKQIKALNKTLKQTKIFEEKVQMQLEIDKKRFESEKPNVSISVEYSKYNDPDYYRLLYDLRNEGKRMATDFEISGIVIFGNNEKIINHVILNKSSGSLEVPIIENRR